MRVKTTISLDAVLFEQAERLAEELQLSRSGLYAQALGEFVERQKSQKLLDGLNAAYGERVDPDDDVLLRGISRSTRRISDLWK